MKVPNMKLTAEIKTAILKYINLTLTIIKEVYR